MHLLMLPQQTVFVCDTYINPDPTAEQLADIALLAAEGVRRFGLEPRLALLSHSSFGSADTPTARKMRDALALIRERAPALEAEGEMHADAALSKRVLDQVFPDSTLSAEANLLVMPNLDAANNPLRFHSADAKNGGRYPGYVAFRTTDRAPNPEVLFTVVCYHAMFSKNKSYNWIGLSSVPQLGPVTTSNSGEVLNDDATTLPH